MSHSNLNKTALHAHHIALKAKMVNFCDFEMPLYYQGIIPEHLAVRNSVGIFDVSHMGVIFVTGKEAVSFLDSLFTNQIAGKENFSAIYGVFPNEMGGAVDDVIIYKINDEKLFLVANACNRKKDLDHLTTYAKGFDVKISDRFDEFGILSIQGPKALELGALPSNLKPMHFFEENDVYVARTGYTGEKGFEVIAKEEEIVKLWDFFTEKGAIPIGLGARDSLRLEKGYALYGHELKEDESVSSWTIKWNKDFLGKERVNKKFIFGVILQDNVIARENFHVYKGLKKIGHVTSGGFSPILKKAIAMILVEENLKIADVVEIEIRNKMHCAEIVQLPFI